MDKADCKIAVIEKRGKKFNIDYSDKRFSSKDWFDRFYENWEDFTFDAFDRWLNKDFGYLDIGAWIGPTVLYGAQLSKYCIALEPERVSHSILINNIKANPLLRVTTINKALCPDTGTQSIYFRGFEGSSGSSLIQRNTSTKGGYSVQGISLEDLISQENIDLNDINFVKIDIEGGEFFLIPAIKDYLQKFKPTLHLSTHQFKLDPESRSSSLRKLMDSISFYKYIYDSKWQLVDISSIEKKSDTADFLLSMEPYIQ